MSRRCNKQVCTHDRAGSRALERSEEGQFTPLQIHLGLHLSLLGAPFNFRKSCVNVVRWKDRSILLVEAAEVLYCLNQHEHQLMVGAPHPFS